MNSVITVEADLRFWQSFLNLSISEYKNKDIRPEEVFTSIFTAYNINPNSNTEHLMSHEYVLRIKTLDLDKHSKEFFTWVSNMSILKTYNCLEIFILQVIQIFYFPSFSNPIDSRKASEQINNQIRIYLNSQNAKYDTKNNRHIIQFLKLQSPEFSLFLKKPIRVDLITNWGLFFEFISILRNVITHNSAVMNHDTHNEIRSKMKDVFIRYFNMSNDNLHNLDLQPKPENFLDFLCYFNDFAVNTVKFIYDEKDLSMLKMK